jgi:hypothetical protein
MKEIVNLLSRVIAGVAALGGVVRLSGEFKLHDDFNSVGIDREVDRRVDAYVPLVRITRPVIKEKFQSSRKLREVGSIWIAEIEARKIETIMPAFHGESILDGPKADAIRTCLSLSNRLSELAMKESRTQSNPSQAFEDTMCAIKLVNLVRYGSAETMVCAATYLVKPTLVLDSLQSRLPQEKLRLAERELVPDVSDPRVVRMQHLEKAQQLQYAIRYGTQQARLDKNLYLADLALSRPNDSMFRAFGPFARGSGSGAQKFASDSIIARSGLQQ